VYFKEVVEAEPTLDCTRLCGHFGVDGNREIFDRPSDQCDLDKVTRDPIAIVDFHWISDGCDLAYNSHGEHLAS